VFTVLLGAMLRKAKPVTTSELAASPAFSP